MSKTAASRKGSFLRNFFGKKEPSAKAPSRPAAAPFDSAKASERVPRRTEKATLPRIPAPPSERESEPKREPTREELRKKILDSIPMAPGEPEIRLTEKISEVCVALQQIQYQDTIQPLIQAGLEMTLEHWAEIHERLEKGESVQIEEARRAATAINTMLCYAPKLRWQLIREINEDHLAILQDSEDGPIEEGSLKEKCLEGMPFIIGDLNRERDNLARARLAPPGSHAAHTGNVDLALAQEASREILKNPNIKDASPGKTEQLNPKQPEVSSTL